MLISFLRTVVLYLLLIVTVRLMGKRQIGEMEPAEFVVTMLLANLAAIPKQDSAIPLLSGLVPILVILGLELILAASSAAVPSGCAACCAASPSFSCRTGKFSNGICSARA